MTCFIRNRAIKKHDELICTSLLIDYIITCSNTKLFSTLLVLGTLPVSGRSFTLGSPSLPRMLALAVERSRPVSRGTIPSLVSSRRFASGAMASLSFRSGRKSLRLNPLRGAAPPPVVTR